MLHRDKNGLYLQLNDFLPFRIDFHVGKLRYRASQLKNEMIAKAVGIKPDQTPSVIDATAGCGRDAFILSQLGCDVIAIEKNDVVFALLDDALSRAGYPFKLVHADAVDFLGNLKIKPDVIYLDPMFPVRKKSAKVKKEMQILEFLLKYEDSAALFDIALQTAQKRVVVKRPKNAQTLTNKKPDMVYEGKTIRFDVNQLHNN